MSSHREAPEISKDPVADNTDVYAFRSVDAPNAVTFVANFNPFELPYGGPNFYEFADDVVYAINISNRGDARADIRYEFRFTTTVRRPSFLYNTGVINDITDPTWNRPQTYTLTKVVRGAAGAISSTVLGRGLPVPPVNVGRRSIPDYARLERQAVTALDGGVRVFAGQRSDPFFVDLGSVFDLAGLRPFNALHLIPLPTADGVNGLQGLNVHSLVLQVPITHVTRDGVRPANVFAAHSTIGVWASASRPRSTVRENGGTRDFGEQVQVSRLGNPLFNEVLVPMARKDEWNSLPPSADSRFAQYVTAPELQRLLPALYPGVFPHLAAYRPPRADLAAILLTGLPTGVINDAQGNRLFQNFTGPTQADMLRLNVAVPPTTNPKPLGILTGDLAGFPNGRRLVDDVVTVELRAIAGLTIPLVDPGFTPDAAAGQVTDGTSNTNLPLLETFPYVARPAGGYQSAPGRPGIGRQDQNAG